MRPLVVVSPHLDDAVLSCGALLAVERDPVVVTVFAGPRPADVPLTEWDQSGGFGPDDDVVAERRAEDRAALQLLGARPRWLGFLDSQYGTNDRAAIVQALADEFRSLQPRKVVIPLGLFHSDHHLASAAAMDALRKIGSPRCWAYEDVPYRALPDGFVADAIRRLETDGVRVRRIAPTAPDLRLLERKRQALRCYASQVAALSTPGRPGVADALRPEGYWALTLNAPVRTTAASTPSAAV